MSVCVQDVLRRFLATQVPPSSYTGVFLDPASRVRLIRWWHQAVGTQLYKQLHVDHMTIKFEPSEKEIAALPLGSKASLRVVGWAEDERCQAVLVVPQGVASANKYPHVTMACDADTSASYSNELLSRGFTRTNGPRLTGIIEAR